MRDTFAPVSWDLPQWMGLNASRRRRFLESAFAALQTRYGFSGALSFVMPEGFEGAYGVYDSLNAGLCVAPDLLGGDGIQILFTFCHELRHLLQFQFPQSFPPFLRESLRYVLQYDGRAMLLEKGESRPVQLSGTPAYFLDLYLAHPMEQDANSYAYRCLSCSAGAETYRQEIERWADMWRPKYRAVSRADMEAELKQVFRLIDEKAAL